MIEKIQHATASSPEGAKGLVKGVLACAFQNMAFMLPTGLLYLLVKDMLAGSTSGRKGFYLLGCAACFALILLTTWFQYNGTYFTTYKESGTRRLTLAERLRKLPLSFFGKRDLADLTSTIMADCEVLEKDCSHFIPGLFGSLISTVLIALSLFAFDGRMALAALWVIPVSVAIVVGSYRVQDKVQAKTMAAKMACADGIQEYIETLRDLKASNAEQRYLSGLSGKIRAVEKQSIAAELETALFVSSASMVLKLGIASVALTGSVLLVQGSIDVLTLFLFLMAASRMYDPMQGALQNLAAVIAMRTNVGRMNEILDAPLQTGSEQLTNQGCDIVFDHVGFAYNSGETVLRDVSFTAKQGEVTALVGPSGGGKTTVSRLAARFWDYQKGSITVGGMEVSRIDPEKLMSLYSIVFQDVTLFDNTILENIRLGRKGATDEEVLAAAKLRGICRKAAGQVEHEHRREWLRPFRRRASAHFHCPCLPEGRAHHSAGRSHRQLGRGERNCHSGGTFPAHKTQNRSYHRPPDAHRSRCGQNRGAVRRRGGRTGRTRCTLCPERPVHPHGGSADRKPELGHLTQFKNSPSAQQKRTSIRKNRCPFYKYITAQPCCAVAQQRLPDFERLVSLCAFFINQRRRIHEQRNHAGKHTIC